MKERTQPVFGAPFPGPAMAELDRGQVTPDRLGTRFVGVAGLYRGHTFALVGETVTIGRDPHCMVALCNDPTVSRAHARVVLEDAGHVLHDECSANGSFVNGVLVRACVLAPGDVVQCGTTRLRYE